MKMNYRRNKNKKIIVIFLSVVLIATTFYFFKAPVGAVLTAGTQSLAYPLLKTGNTFQNYIAQYKAFLVSKKTLQEENEILRERVETQRLLLLSKEALFEENQELKERLGRREDKDLILAAVLSRPDSSPYDTFIIDIGKERVSVGDQVSIAGEIILGAVAEVYTYTSKVVLLSSGAITTDVLLEEEESEEGFISAKAHGIGGGNFKIELPRDVSIKNDSIVYIPGLRISPIGKVGHIEKNPNNSFQTVYAHALVNMQNVKWVEVENTQ